MKTESYTLIYAAGLGIICAGLLTAAGQFTAPRISANAEAEKLRNVFDVLGISYVADASVRQLAEIASLSIRESVHDVNGRPIRVYRYLAGDGQVRAIAVGFEGTGMWGPIKGFLAFEPDGRTIRAVSFYEQQETPGLGGEIASTRFRERFGGRQILDAAGRPGIRIGPASAEPNHIEAISGATMTCEKVQQMINQVIEQLGPILVGEGEQDVRK